MQVPAGHGQKIHNWFHIHNILVVVSMDRDRELSVNIFSLLNSLHGIEELSKVSCKSIEAIDAINKIISTNSIEVIVMSGNCISVCQSVSEGY